MALKSTQKYTLELREKIDESVRSTGALVQEQEKAKIAVEETVVETSAIQEVQEPAVEEQAGKKDSRKKYLTHIEGDYYIELVKISKRNRESLNRTINKAIADYIVRHS